MDIININGFDYSYYKPIGCDGVKLYKKQIKRVKEKIRACQYGCYKDKLTKNGVKYYNDYPDLLVFLEGLK